MVGVLTLPLSMFGRFLWRHVEPWHKLHLYFFSSYFFTQLNANKGPRDRSPATADERFARVARWTQKETNLFDKHFLFIPINDRCVYVVCWRVLVREVDGLTFVDDRCVQFSLERRCGLQSGIRYRHEEENTIRAENHRCSSEGDRDCD